MAIHAKTNGWLIGGKVITENATSWTFHAMDEKSPKLIAKNDPKNKVFNSENAVDEAMKWQKEARKAK